MTRLTAVSSTHLFSESINVWPKVTLTMCCCILSFQVHVLSGGCNCKINLWMHSVNCCCLYSNSHPAAARGGQLGVFYFAFCHFIYIYISMCPLFKLKYYSNISCCRCRGNITSSGNQLSNKQRTWKGFISVQSKTRVGDILVNIPISNHWKPFELRIRVKKCRQIQTIRPTCGCVDVFCCCGLWRARIQRVFWNKTNIRMNILLFLCKV